MSNRCTGLCCRAFPCAPYEELRKKPHVFDDGPKILDMLVPLGEHTTHPVTGMPLGGPVALYTCRHHNVETGDCAIYADRPAMCVEYPYGHDCEHQGACSWEAARVETVTPLADFVPQAALFAAAARRATRA